ncbi:MAG: hypothetical protein EOP85_04440 [Verrucomicrobiaceae bacterium]|nr:MAG: hypothetical protein EOP85_04440 [Verrucomicrobiaceae bacterium]
MKNLLVASSFACLLASCATPESYTDKSMEASGKNTSVAYEDHTDGFTTSIRYTRYQFIPESNAVAIAGKSALMNAAYQEADRRGRKIQTLNEQRIRQSMGRNGFTGITSYSGSVKATYTN